VAWLTFRKRDGTHSDGRIRICDSDSPGAFKVYRTHPRTTGAIEALRELVDALKFDPITAPTERFCKAFERARAALAPAGGAVGEKR
jgi:hypothetical protein